MGFIIFNYNINLKIISKIILNNVQTMKTLFDL